MTVEPRTPGVRSRVLLIDDDPGTIDTLTDILRLRGFDVDTGQHGEEALARMRHGRFDAAILDLRLPDMSGLELLHAIKAISVETEVIFITGHASLATAMQAVNGAAFAYLVKPVEVDHLLATLDKALDRRRLARELQESEARYRLLTESISDAIFLLDLEGRLLLGNGRVEALTGYPLDELRGQSILSLLDEPSADLAAAHLTAVREGREAPATFAGRLRRRDGQFRFIEATVTSVERQGEVIGRLAAVRDVTERRQLEDGLRQAQKMEAVGRLAGGVAHDFNNMLTVIGGRLILLLDALPADSPLRRHAELAALSTNRASSVARQLLAFSRQQPVQTRVLSPNLMIESIGKLLERLIGEDIQLIVQPRPDLGRVRGDPGQLEQVIINLAVNARDAMPRGGRLILETDNVELDATYTARHEGLVPGRYVMLAVTDTGIGMDAATRTRIFEPFFTTKDPGQGTGLGLAIVWGLVHQSAGHVEVYSEPGAGTTFKIYLPRVDEALSPDMAGETGPPPRGTETVLVVEDQEDVRGLAREVLETVGYTVLDAESPAAALDLLARYPGHLHLLLTDMVMPGMSGRELAAVLRVQRPGLRVVYMSGYPGTAIAANAALEPDVPFIQKPFSLLALTRIVRATLDRPEG